MRNIKFKFAEYNNDKLKSIYNNIEIKYNKKDMCLYTLNGGGNGMLAIENSNVILNFDLETKRICGIDGYIGDLNLIQNAKLSKITTRKSGILYVSTNENFLSGIAYEFKFGGNVNYDRENSILSLGEFDNTKELYCILKNVYVQLDGYIRCILIAL